MRHCLGRIFFVFAAILFWYVALPVQRLLAVSENVGSIDWEKASSPEAVGGSTSAFLLLVKLVVSFVIIVGLAWLVMRLLRKNIKVTSRGENIRILDQYAFSLNKGVYVTEIAGRVFVLGITDHNINLISEIEDEATLTEIRTKAEELERDRIIPSGFMSRLFPGLVPETKANKKSFNVHFREQIDKLQTLAGGLRDRSREDDENDQK